MARVLFLPDLSFEYPGTMILSACLKRAGHSTDVLIEKRHNRILLYIKEYNPNIIAFSVMTGPHKWALEIAHEIKKLIKLPPNLFFKIWWGIMYVYVYIRSEERQVGEVISTIFQNIPRDLFKKTLDNSESP